jgi:hypothetical protein
MAQIPLEGSELAAYAHSQGVQVALLYDSLYTSDGKNHLPTQWRRVARWTIQNNISAGDATLSIYAMDQDGADRLKLELQEFSPTLPSSVSQHGESIP